VKSERTKIFFDDKVVRGTSVGAHDQRLEAVLRTSKLNLVLKKEKNKLGKNSPNFMGTTLQLRG
jgi:hypothetical protein